ncbi:MAG: potassium-transporting ATPase subunit KdpA [Bacteroidales bacterium]|nr:potassium-transporting ATPase subunit KdpA [Bacteroidales bacterium]
MSINEIIQIIIYLGLLILVTPLLGGYMAKVFNGKKHFMLLVFGWLERFVYKLGGVNPEEEANWKKYIFGLLMFNLAGFLFLFLIQLFQQALPMNTEKLPNVSWHLSFNTATSFITNTNWQSYAGESTLSYFVQMMGLTVQNFVSAATGIAVVIALIRGLARKTASTIGNFWVDLTRSTVYILLPLSIIFAVVLMGEGVVQNFSAYEKITTLSSAEQVVPMGPAASQIAIKQLGSNGGGFFNTNSAHPFENPTPLTNFLQMFSLLIIAAALTYTYGKMIGSTRQGWVIFSAMFIMFVAGLTISLWAETGYNASMAMNGLMEGKETRFGIGNSVLWSVATTSASNGSVNAMHDSLTPISGMVAMFNIMLGEVIFGGVGAGLYGMLIFVILTVFIAGLMVGRTPEFLGKKIGTFEIKMAMIAALAPNVVILLFSAICVSTTAGLVSLNNSGPHGLSEILYAFSSAAGNNGSAFAGLNANVPLYNVLLGLGMLIGRFGIIIPVLAIAGSMVQKKITPPSSGTFKTDNGIFVFLLISVVIIVGGLTHFPALALGPIVEHLLMNMGVTF